MSTSEGFEKIQHAFSQINFTSFDFNTIKQSLLDYIKTYFIEDYNDIISSSELIAILELFAYVGELLSYRIDINASENFITTATRKESILRLAKLISYKASRNLPNRGLVKITSILTTEPLQDANRNNLANKVINWNDNNNSNWYDQFLIIINSVLEQPYGTVAPNERIQVDDVLFELYTLNNNPLKPGNHSLFSYTTSVSGTSLPMEVVPVILEKNGPREKRPEIDSKFSILYANDGLGNASDTTGFMMLTKQGTLQQTTKQFDGIIPNQSITIDVDNINETDVWVNNVDSDTRKILSTDPLNPQQSQLNGKQRFGEWTEVDLAHAQNILFNTNKNRHKYEIETLDNDHIKIIFGDGEFSDIPAGVFDIWYRTSINQHITIPKSAITNQTATLTYNDKFGNIQTLTLTFSLINSLQNGAISESLEHIRRVAPSTYYSQDRMVNDRDYNNFMLQDPSILRIKTINRTFAGDSKYIAWNDPTEHYQDVKMFGEDLALYWDEHIPENGRVIEVNQPLSVTQLLLQHIQPILSTTDLFFIINPELQLLNDTNRVIRKIFHKTIKYSEQPVRRNDNEYTAISKALQQAKDGNDPVVHLYYSATYDEWTVNKHPNDTIPNTGYSAAKGSANSKLLIIVQAKFKDQNLIGWTIYHRTKQLVAYSEDTKFWNTNQTNQILNFDTLNTVLDKITVLQSNTNAENDGILKESKKFNVLSQRLIEPNLENAGLPDIHRLSLVPVDTNQDKIPDNVLLPNLFQVKYFIIEGDKLSEQEKQEERDAGATSYNNEIYKLKNSYLIGFEDEDLIVYKIDYKGIRHRLFHKTGDWVVPPAPLDEYGDPIIDRIEENRIQFPKLSLYSDESIEVIFNNHIYFKRMNTTSQWIAQKTTTLIKNLFLTEKATTNQGKLYARYPGRFPLNFSWFHYNTRLNLIDPASSNIMDMYVITFGYYQSMQLYLQNKITDKPAMPSSQELKTTYNHLLQSKMISDTVILYPGTLKILFGSKSHSSLQGTFRVIRPTATSLTDNQVKNQIVSVIRDFFNITQWEFGQTLYLTELTHSIHSHLGGEIDSIVFVPSSINTQFGDMFIVTANNDEMFIPDISPLNIEIVKTFTSDNLRQKK